MAAHAARLSTTTALTAVVVLGAAAPAAAHVTVASSTTAAGALAVLTVTVAHGCQGSPTTAITISIPAGVTSVTPERSAAWAVGPPAVSSGVEGGAVVTYRATSPLPDGARGEVDLQLRLPDAAGTTLAFPTVQTCERGESAWIEVPAAGQSAADLQLPAPTVALTAGAPGEPAVPSSVPAATPEAATSASARAFDTASEPSQTPGSGARDGSGSVVSAAALTTGAVGVLVGGGLVHRRRRT